MKRPLRRTRNLVRLTACLLSFVLLAQAAPAVQGQSARALTSYVDPFVGADAGGNTVPGAKVPFGFANPSPDTVPNPDPSHWDTSGYESDKDIIGFSQTHVSGTGGEGKYGNFRVTPQTGEVSPKDLASPKSGERAGPGYYAVTLTKPGVRAELTATRLVAVHRYAFDSDAPAHILVDAGSVVFTGGGAGRRQRPVATRVVVRAPDRIEGSGSFVGGWNPSPYTLHFCARFSRPFLSHGTWRDGEVHAGASAVSGEQTPAGAFVTFNQTPGRNVELKVGVSFVSPEKACANVEDETRGANFDEVRRRASRLWEDALSKISVEGGTEDERRIFYTALYRSHYMPHDLTGENAWWESEEPHYEDFYAIWDTFRTLHPLLTLVQPARQRDMLRSLVDTYRHTGWMPDARVAGSNGMTQGGSNSDVLVADAIVKGVRGVDYETAYRAMRRNAEEESPRPLYEGREIGDFNARGYLSTLHERSASRTLEYAYDDFCLAQVAGRLGRAADRRRYLALSRGWEGLWDEETKSIRPRDEYGARMTPFDKTKLYMLDYPRFTWLSAPYYEGSAYQYSTYVPHDARGLIDRVGGDEAFVRWLDAFFGETKDEGLRPEGLYTHNNEPDLLAPFLYTHAGRADKAQVRVRLLMSKEYRTGRAGLPGNDDSGTISSWYVWNAVGLYPNAGQDFYYVGSPLFTRSRILLGAGRAFTVLARGASRENPYVQSAALDGRTLTRAWLRHSELARGGTLVLEMGPKPSRWGSANRPPSLSPAPAR
ncbi:MAG TPA: GH92 family glycosyl hydrolase [Pyrinomonadaceae bacterium]|nr:GH92 family glycosyl hydrolase [Pyrinomonadaceae bacterium]